MPMAPPPRAKAVLGGILMLVATAVLVLGVILPWNSGRGESVNGFDNYYCIGGFCSATSDDLPDLTGSNNVQFTAPGFASIIGAVILGSFGLALLLAGRVKTLGILAIIGSSLGLIVFFATFWIVGEVARDQGVDTGPGVYLTGIGAVLGIAAGIVTLSQRGDQQPAAWSQPQPPTTWG